MYSLIKPLLFKFDPERVHHFVTNGLRLLNKIPGGPALSEALWVTNDKRLELEDLCRKPATLNRACSGCRRMKR